MKILFIENKFKTVFWDEIALSLIDQGYEVHWIVQNRLFTPKHGIVHLISLPKKNALKYNSKFRDLEKKDRFSYIYDNEPLHYDYYESKIDSIIKDIDPNIVFGESTLFHELLTIDICKELGILYLHPTTSRYPNSRLCFYKYDTLDVFGGSKDVFEKIKIDEIIDNINNRNLTPDYMKRSRGFRKLKHKIRILKNLTYSLITSLSGEKYNTPNLLEKLKVSRRNKILENRFYKNACKLSTLEKSKGIIVPLQMQPESNLDVWGFPYNNQVTNIKSILESTASDWKVFIKSNPKSKCEMSNELISIIEQESRVVALEQNVTMAYLLDKFNYFYSVTGTINYECIFKNKICFSPKFKIKLVVENNKIEDYNNIRVDEHVWINNSSEELLSHLIYTSYDGRIGSSIHSPQVFESENIKKVTLAFVDVVIKTQEGIRLKNERK